MPHNPYQAPEPVRESPAGPIVWRRVLRGAALFSSGAIYLFFMFLAAAALLLVPIGIIVTLVWPWLFPGE